MNATKIRELSEEKRLSIKSLSEYLNITEGGVQHIIRNGSTGTATLEKIATFFGVHPGVFFDDSPVKVDYTGQVAPCDKCREKDKEILLLNKVIDRDASLIDALTDQLRIHAPHTSASGQD